MYNEIPVIDEDFDNHYIGDEIFLDEVLDRDLGEENNYANQ